MRNIEKCIDTYNNKVESDFKIIVNGRYEKVQCQDELDLIRFMIGGINAK
ncbi:hypothetical protein V7O66_06225 [Methanolobus sp. ZRKC3]